MVNDIKIGNLVKVISKASYLHYKQIGRVVGFTKNDQMAYVQFEGEENKVQFYKDSLEVVPKDITYENLFKTMTEDEQKWINNDIKKYLSGNGIPMFSTLGRFKRTYIAYGKFIKEDGLALFEKDLNEYVEKQKELS